MTFTAEVIISGFVSKVVNNCVDVSWDKIKNAVNNKNNKNQSLESQIYNVTVDVFNKITNNQYENNQDKLYEAAEMLLLGYKCNNEDDIEVIRSSLKLFYASVDNHKCMEFMKMFYQELSKDDYSNLYREIILLQVGQVSKKITRIEKSIDHIKDELVNIKNNGEKQKDVHVIMKRDENEIESKPAYLQEKFHFNLLMEDYSISPRQAKKLYEEEKYAKPELSSKPSSVYNIVDKPLYITTLSLNNAQEINKQLECVQLIFLRNGQYIGSKELPNKKIRIGREQRNDVVIKDRTVSRKQCLIVKENDIFILKNYSRANKTRLNGKIVNNSKEIKYGDVVGIGNIAFTFERVVKAGQVV